MKSQGSFKKHAAIIVSATGLILLVPLIGMQFSDEVNWNFFDFIFAGAMLLGTGFAFELLSRKGGSTAYKAAVALSVGAALLLVWINLAVGIIGSENNPLNIMYFGVLLVEIAGVIIARLKPDRMALAMFTTAAVMMLVPVIALFIGQPQASTTEEVMGIVGVFMLNAFFALLFVGSALLYKRAGEIEG